MMMMMIMIIMITTISIIIIMSILFFFFCCYYCCCHYCMVTVLPQAFLRSPRSQGEKLREQGRFHCNWGFCTLRPRGFRV